MFTKKGISFKLLCALMALSFFSGIIGPDIFRLRLVYAGGLATLTPDIISTTPSQRPWALQGIKIYPDNPLKFDFLLEEGDAKLSKDELKREAELLIRYFLACLTLPEEDLWVNLSPFEQDKIIPESTSLTELGKGLLEQDYLLKRLVSSMTYPENPLGQSFWQKVYAQAYQRFGTSKLPVNTFNKVWIIPDQAVVYEDGERALIKESRLKVMMEEDYLAFRERRAKDEGRGKKSKEDDEKNINNLSSQVMKEVVIPAIEEEINSGETFIPLRQMYRSFILASWFKKRLRESLLGQVYVDQKKTKGIDLNDPQFKEKVFQQYLASYKDGLYNYIRRDYSPLERKHIKRRYWSGGAKFSFAESPLILNKASSLVWRWKGMVKVLLVTTTLSILPLDTSHRDALAELFRPSVVSEELLMGPTVTLTNGKVVNRADLYMMLPVLHDLSLNHRKAFFELWKALYSIGITTPRDWNKPANHITTQYLFSDTSKKILLNKNLITSFGQSVDGVKLTNIHSAIRDIILAMVDTNDGKEILNIMVVPPVKDVSFNKIRETRNSVVDEITKNQIPPLFENKGQPIRDFLSRHPDISPEVKEEIREALKETKESLAPEAEKAIQEYLSTGNLSEAKENLAQAQGINDKLAERMLILARLMSFVALQFDKGISAHPQSLLEMLPYLIQGENGISRKNLIKSILGEYDSSLPGHSLISDNIELILEQANYYALSMTSSPLPAGSDKKLTSEQVKDIVTPIAKKHNVFFNDESLLTIKKKFEEDYYPKFKEFRETEKSFNEITQKVKKLESELTKLAKESKDKGAIKEKQKDLLAQLKQQSALNSKNILLLNQLRLLPDYLILDLFKQRNTELFVQRVQNLRDLAKQAGQKLFEQTRTIEESREIVQKSLSKELAVPQQISPKKEFEAFYKEQGEPIKKILEALAKEITASSSISPGGVDLLGKDFTVTTQGPGLQGYHPGAFPEILAHPELVLGLEISSIEIGK